MKTKILNLLSLSDLSQKYSRDGMGQRYLQKAVLLVRYAL